MDRLSKHTAEIYAEYSNENVQRLRLKGRCLELEKVIASLRSENRIEAALVKLCGEENKRLKQQNKKLKEEMQESINHE